MHPTSNSLADQLCRLDHSGFQALVGPPSDSTLGTSPAAYQGLLADRLTGSPWHRVDGNGILVTARFSPVTRLPNGLAFCFDTESPSRTDLERRLEELGLPLPDYDPTLVIEADGAIEARAVAYLPGPPRLAELVYHSYRQGRRLSVVVWIGRPAEPRHSRLVEAYRRRYSWEGTMWFPDLWSFEARKGELLPLGEGRSRRFLY